MADLKTTQDRRERFVTWLHMPGEDRYSVRAWATAEDACDDVEVLLRENAKLRALAEAARAWDERRDDLAATCMSCVAITGPRREALKDACAAFRSALEAP